MSATARAAVTPDDLLRMPDGERFELVRGELRPMNPTNFEHFRITDNVTFPISRFVRERKLGIVGGEGGFELEIGRTVLAPDVAFVAAERVPDRARQRQGWTPLAPDFVAEILSPSNTAEEVAEKVLIHLRAGVRLLWIVDPKHETVTVHWPDRTARIFVVGETLDGGDVLPGFSLPVAEVFA
jgi:Uma2 family endonuclease